jgi:hypothetical protein
MLSYLEELDELSVRISQEAALIMDKQHDLCHAFEQIIGNQGVCRESGMLIARNVPSLESITPNQFTLFPTQTNITVAVEGFWKGIMDGISAVFELVFSLIFGVIKLLLKPLEWLFGGEGGGATGKASSSVSNMSNPAVIEAVEEVPDKKKVEVLKEFIDNTRLNVWELLIIKSANTDMFNSINADIPKIYDNILYSMERYTRDILNLQGGDDFVMKLSDLNVYSEQVMDSIGKYTDDFFNNLPKELNYKAGSIVNIGDVNQHVNGLERHLLDLESKTLEGRVLERSVVNALKDLKATVGVYEARLNFNDSDESLYESLDTYTSKFEKLSNSIDKLGGLNFEKKGITPEQIKDIKNSITEQRKFITVGNNLIRLEMKIAIKGKRALFKGIRILEDASLIIVDKASSRTLEEVLRENIPY